MIEFRTLGTVSLRARDGASLDSPVSGSKRLALLVYLALARPRGLHRRDALLPLLYPESDQKHGRGALRNLLHQIRASLGADVIISRGSEEIGTAEGALWCDALAFEEALQRGEHRRALELYGGDLLEGFHAPDVAPEFEHWLDSERTRLRSMAADAAWALADEQEAAGTASGAAHWARRAVAFVPLDEGAIQRLLRLLERVGDRTGALQAYDEFAQRLAAEWELAPSAETQLIVQAIRAAEPHLPEVPAKSQHSPSGPTRPHPLPRGVQGSPPTQIAPTRPTRRLRLRPWSAALAGAIILAAIVLAFTLDNVPESAPVVAVGPIQTRGVSGSINLAPAIRSLLTADLARTPGLQVVGTERLHDLLRQDGGDPGQSAAWARAARTAGATVLIEGVLSTQPDGDYRLSLVRRDLQTGQVADAAVAVGPDPYGLVDRASVQVLSSLDVGESPSRLVRATTRSPAAYRLYEQGVRAYYAGDTDTAHRLLSAALGEDSLFAMAAYYRALSRERVDHYAFRRDLGRAARLSERAADRERLLIRSAWAQEMDEPRQLALAETLTARYPHEPDGHLSLGKARLWSGDYAGALPHLRRAARMDSLRSGEDKVRCRACDALHEIVNAYMLQDSLTQAQATARRWVDRQPGSARAWHSLASALEYRGRHADALDARRRAADLRNAANPRDAVYPAVLALRAGAFARADSLLDRLDGSPDELVRQNVLWYRTLGLLYRGRYEEALRTARTYREAVLAAETSAQRRPWESVLEAMVLQEMGRPREAARLWRAMAEYPYEPESLPRTARHRAWTLTHLASALALAGDTAQLPALVDTIQALGAQSAYGRDPRLHHYVRGLMSFARGDTAAAAEQFRRSVFSPTAGYGRTNLELGRALLALGRPQEAARILGAALRGPLDAGNLYVNRTEIHLLLARALRAAGQPDSARVHEGWIMHARQR